VCGGIGGSATASRFLHPSPHKVVVERGGNVEWTHTHHEYMDRGTFRGKGGKVTKIVKISTIIIGGCACARRATG